MIKKTLDMRAALQSGFIWPLAWLLYRLNFLDARKRGGPWRFSLRQGCCTLKVRSVSIEEAQEVLKQLAFVVHISVHEL